MANFLFAPIIERKFVFEENQETNYIPFDFPSGIGNGDETWNRIRLIVKTINTGKILYEKTYQQDSVVSYNKKQALKIAKEDELYTKLTKKQYYKIQIAFGYNDNIIGNYSDIGICKYIPKITLAIKDLNKDEVEIGKNQFIGYYKCNEDSTEKVYKYKFDLFNSNNELVKTTDWCLHNSQSDISQTESTNVWKYQGNSVTGEVLWIQYSVLTTNGLLKLTDKYPIKFGYKENLIAQPLLFTPVAYCNSEEGSVVVELRRHQLQQEDWISGTYILSRSSSEDNYTTQENIIEFSLKQWYTKNPLIIFKDYTVKHGFTYRYGIQQKNRHKILSTRYLMEYGEVTVDFEHMFLSDGERQLKIKFNPKITSFKRFTQEQKLDTIGGEYPFFFRNEKIKYHEFPISGLISMLMDEDNSFKMDLIQQDTRTRIETPSRSPVAQNNFSTQLSTENIYNERQFKMAVYEWLNNGKPKIFRSPTEGNFIVRLMNVSLTPNDTLGRMLHSFNATAYECMEYNYNNLEQLGMFKFIEQNYYKYVIVEEYDMAINGKHGQYTSYYFDDNTNQVTTKTMIHNDMNLLYYRGWARWDKKNGVNTHYYITFPDDNLPEQLTIFGKVGTTFRINKNDNYQFTIGHTGVYHFNASTIQGGLKISKLDFTAENRKKLEKIQAVFVQKETFNTFNYLTQVSNDVTKEIGQYGGYGLNSGTNQDGELCIPYQQNSLLLQKDPTAFFNMTSRYEDFDYLRLQVKEEIALYFDSANSKWYKDNAHSKEVTDQDIEDWAIKFNFRVYNLNGIPITTKKSNLYCFHRVTSSNTKGYYYLPPDLNALYSKVINPEDDYKAIINGKVFDLRQWNKYTDIAQEEIDSHMLLPKATEGYLEFYKISDINSIRLGKCVLIDFVVSPLYTTWGDLPGYSDLTEPTPESSTTEWKKYYIQLQMLYNQALNELRSIGWEIENE